MSYAAMIETLAGAVASRCTSPFNLVVVDGIPAGGKSSLTALLAEQLEARGRATVTVENDWFIARSIRNPVSIVLGLGLALSPASMAKVEQRLLASFLDRGRLGDFQRELLAAQRILVDAPSVTLRPRGAFWNLQTPLAWESVAASKGLSLARGGVVLVEGTLTAAAYRARFPGLVSVYVTVPPAVARQRFLQRNRAKLRRRNWAFTALARNGLAFRLAAEMIGRDRGRFDFEVDLEDLEQPRLRGVSAPNPSRAL